MLIQDPLALPELRTLVARFLSPKDILTCLLVCKAWHYDLKNFLWFSLCLDDPTMRLLAKDVLRQHAHLIRHLVLMEPMRFTPAALCAPLSTEKMISSSSPIPPRRTILGPPTSTCTNLLSLDIHPSILFRKHVHELPKHVALSLGTDRYDHIEDRWCLQSTDACIRLIQQNPRLQCLTESWDDMSSFHRIKFARQLCYLTGHSIAQMHLSKWTLSAEELNVLLLNSTRLEYLRFAKLRICRENVHTAPSTTTTATTTTASAAEGNLPDSLPLQRLNLRQLKTLVLTYAQFQPMRLQIDGPELRVLNIAFSQTITPQLQQPHMTQAHQFGSNMQQDQSLIQDLAQPYSAVGSVLKSLPSWSKNPDAYIGDLRSGTVPLRVVWNTPRLERLICSRTESQVANSTLWEIPTSIKTLSVADYEIDSKLAMEVILRQGNTLESIRFACFTGIGAKDVAFILRSCPNLVNFYAPEVMIWIGDLVQPAAIAPESDDIGDKFKGDNDRQQEQRQHIQLQQPWVCRNLEKLSIYVCLQAGAVEDEYSPYPDISIPGAGVPSHAIFHSEVSSLPSSSFSSSLDEGRPPIWHHLQQQQQEQQVCMHRVRSAFLHQISQLTRLKYLDLSGEHVERVDHLQIGLPLTLDGGMEHLESLKALEHIAITGWIDEMGIKEIEWMKKSWPRLSQLSMLKTTRHSLGKTRFQDLLAVNWPELLVRDKDRGRTTPCLSTYAY
ncbi:hypothetical protein BGZ83_010690 [Gryganskiella cystojenkinii]|nr:hypothetical protein BGZ83_010690 [Gryganskiella cystojenkinii]